MGVASVSDDPIELRYLGLVRLSVGIAGVSDWRALARAIGEALATADSAAPLRLWGTTADGLGELARYPTDAEFPSLPQQELRVTAEHGRPSLRPDGRLLLGLHASGVSMGVLEVADAGDQGEFLGEMAPIIAPVMGLLAAQGVGDATLEPLSVEAASDAASVVSAFAAEARQLLDHDRLSAYLLTPNRQAFERFAVATSPIIPGEGVVIPFEDVGIRHVVITNRALVADDLSADPRIVGREDRIIARAGFRGLLSVPLRRDGRPIGVLNFVSKTPGFYTEADIPIAQQMADQASAFLENLRRQRRMRALVMQNATERERARLSRDLYDTVAEAVQGIHSIAFGLRERLASVDSDAAAEVERLIELGTNELADMRRAILGMSPRALDSRRLGEVVEGSLAQFRDATGLATTWEIQGEAACLPASVKGSVYRILQESLTNVRLHSRAESVRVEMSVDEGLTLSIEDDGVGFDTEGVDTGDPGLGLAGMIERASALGGTLSIESVPGEGTTVRLEVPALGDARPEASPEGSAEAEIARQDWGTLRVFVAERNNLIRAGLLRILERAAAIRVVGEASSADDVRGQVARLQPDVVLLDEQLEAEYSLKLTQELTEMSPSSAILVAARNATGAASELLEAGGAGIVDKSVAPDELVSAVRAVANGARVIAGSGDHAGSQQEGTSALSRREREILSLVASGRTNAEIAEALFFATKTVERHVATIVAKLGARNRAHAAALAVAHQIIDPEISATG